jgi:hypothetical protein
VPAILIAGRPKGRSLDGAGHMKGRKATPPVEHHPETPKPRGFDDYELRLGDIMRGERATMGKSLLDVQRELRIKATYIAAIENADPTAFETPGFVAGYVRSYARYLNLDPDWAFRTFCEEGRFEMSPAGGPAAKASRQSEARVPGLRDPFTEPTVSFIPKGEARLSRLEPAAIGSLAILVALTGAIGYGGWSVLQEVQRVQLTPVDQVPGVLAEIAPLNNPPAFAAAESGPVAPSTEIFDRLYRPQTLDAPVLVPRDGPIAALDPASGGVLGPDPRERTIASTRMAAQGVVAGDVERAIAQVLMGGDAETDSTGGPGVQVTAQPPEVALLAVQPSWVRVQRADGTIILEKILDAGERFVLPPSDEPHRLRAGNAGSLYFAVNGQTYGPAGTGPSVVRDVALSVDALKDVYTLADLSQNAELARFAAVAAAAADDTQGAD